MSVALKQKLSLPYQVFSLECVLDKLLSSTVKITPMLTFDALEWEIFRCQGLQR